MPSSPWEVLQLSDAPVQTPAPPPAPSAGVAEWATRAAHFSRMVARAWPAGDVPAEVATQLDNAWTLATRASRLEGEVASLSRRLEALEKRGRALRAEIGRKVEELAHEESRVLRDAASEAEAVAELRDKVLQGERSAAQARAHADQLERAGASGSPLRQAYEQAGAAVARLDLRKEQLTEREARAGRKDAQARDLRRQIEELRGQLSRYAEALEDDLAQGREKVTTKTREGLGLEKSFSEASDGLLKHLRGRPECRDLFEELARKQSSDDKGD
jgi:serine/threonine-protein kinase